METTRNGFQPVFTIPVEILCQIFAECTDEDYNVPSNSSPATRVSEQTSFNPFTLGRVCWLWRSVANDFPYLWSKIYVRNPLPRHIDRIKIWLRRSQEHELTIHLRADNDSYVPMLLEAVRIFACYSERWCNVVLEVAEEMLRALSMILLEAARPINLKTVSIVAYDSHELVSERIPYPGSDNDWYSGWYSDVWSYFYSSASLRSVTSASWYDHAALKNAPFHQITTLRIMFNNPAMDIFDILSKCTNLEYLTLKISRILPHSPLQLILPSLDYIQISSKVSVEPLLSRMTAPSLKSLELSFKVRKWASDGPKIVLGFLNRSKCRLSKFEIKDSRFCITNDLLRRYLSIPHLSAVTKLVINCLVRTPILKLLGRTTENSYFIMPELRDLFVTCAPKVRDGTIEELVRSRWPNVWDGSANRKQGYCNFSWWNPGDIGPMDEAFLDRIRTEYLHEYYGITYESM